MFTFAAYKKRKCLKNVVLIVFFSLSLSPELTFCCNHWLAQCLTHHFIIAGSIFYYCSIIYNKPNPGKQTIHHDGQCKRHLVTANKVEEVWKQTKSSWCVGFCHFTGIAIGWIASLFPRRSCDIWLESLLGVLTCLFPEMFEVFAVHWNCINSSRKASEVFS